MSDPLALSGLQIIMAHHGPYRHRSTGWKPGSRARWVVDCLVAEPQYQQIGEADAFLRVPGTVALYAPTTLYRERIDRTGMTMRSWVTFQLTGTLAETMTGLTGETGYCMFQDPDQILARRLERLGILYMLETARHDLAMNGILLELLGLLSSAAELDPQLRIVPDPILQPVGGWLGEVEAEISARIFEPLRVVDLAEAMGSSESAFAHRYRQAAGESPYQTILRLKMVAAKRLLTEGQAVGQVAEALGYSTTFSFSRCFKKRVGLAPSDWLRSIHG